MPHPAHPDVAAAYSQGYDINFTLTRTISEDEFPEWGGLQIRFSLDYHAGRDDDPSIRDLLGDLTIKVRDGEIPDSRADWHRNYTNSLAYLRAHIYRLAMGWQETRLAEELADADAAPYWGAKGVPPSQSQLWKVFNQRWPAVTQEMCKHVANTIRQQARDAGLPVPDDAFKPDTRDIESETSKAELKREKTREVWRQAKPFVTDTFELERGDNASIHENAFWELHAYAGMRADMHAQAGAETFREDTSRDHTPSGSNHRHHLTKLSIPDVRSMLQETTQALVARARHRDELVGDLWAAIDITKGNPFVGDRDGLEDTILGYKNGDHHYQWATIQIVGNDIPLVLDAVPVTRGYSRGDIVDDLLENALRIVGDIELVMMDREFDSEGVKESCADHGVYYLNPTRMRSAEQHVCEQMRENDERYRVKEGYGLGDTTRKRMYVEALNKEVFGDDDDEGDDESVLEQHELHEIVDGIPDLEDGGVAGSLNEDSDENDEDESERAFALFETNHPAISGDASRRNVKGFLWRYSNRWGIENGYKDIKKFRVRTTSKRPQYRFFNFVFACVLYNVWRLVDLLVKVALDDQNEYSPCITAAKFLTLAKKYYGLDPPD